LINAFALSYQKLLKLDKFSILNKKKGYPINVCFNATDFTHGLAFRFQNGDGYFGNKFATSKNLNAIKYHTEIADAVASSSCFPMGFEPMAFPDDFYPPSLPGFDQVKQQPIFREGMGIMDGGIIDNQGIGSMVNINETLTNKLDTIFIIDVSSQTIQDPWKPIPTKGKGISFTLLLAKIGRIFSFRWYNWFFVALGVLMLLLKPVLNTIGFENPYVDQFGGILTGFGTSLLIAGVLVVAARWIIVSYLKSAFKMGVPSVLIDDILAFKKLRSNVLFRMVKERLSSTIMMVDTIFLKQIRRLNYMLLFSKESLKSKVVASFVYELKDDKKLTNLANVATIASEAPTTLWWDKKDRSLKRLECLIAAGQFTLCHQLIKHLEKQDKLNTHEKKFLSVLKKDLIAFEANPTCLV
jgi:hypothetical protein